jgi:hypothetical protein
MENALGLQAVKDGLANLGVKEDPPGSNSGKYVNIYLASVGLPPGNPWCAAFVFFRVQQAAKELGISALWPKTGLVQAVYDWAKSHKLVSDTPAAGMVFVEWFPSLNRYAHTGLIAEVQGNKFRTVEGNSNSNGSRDGEEVASNWRTWGPGYKAIKIV